MRRSFSVAAFILLTAGLAPADAGEPVRIELPVRARLDLDGYRSLVVVPFVAERGEGSVGLPDLEEQLSRYLTRLIERETDLAVTALAVDLPTYDSIDLAGRRSFWQSVGERADADLILAGAVDFDFQDRSGYVTREFVSEQDGRTYFAQVLVERTGVELDLLVWVVDGRTGELLMADNFKDFKAFEGESLAPLDGLFANLATLEDRLLGIFRQRTVTAERLLQ